MVGNFGGQVKGKLHNLREITNYLADADNWDPVTKFVAREYFIIGVILGVILGVAGTTIVCTWSI